MWDAEIRAQIVSVVHRLYSNSLRNLVGKTGEYMLRVRNLTSSSSGLFQDDLNWKVK